MGKGMVAFLRAALGFEPEIMRLGGIGRQKPLQADHG